MKLQMSAAEAKALLKAQVNGELPDERGRFGPFGGRYVPETLVPAFEKLEQGVMEHLHDEDFQAEFRRELREWVGRPTALSYAPRLSERWGTEVWLVAGLGRRLPGPYVEAMVARTMMAKMRQMLSPLRCQLRRRASLQPADSSIMTG